MVRGHCFLTADWVEVKVSHQACTDAFLVGRGKSAKYLLLTSASTDVRGQDILLLLGGRNVLISPGPLLTPPQRGGERRLTTASWDWMSLFSSWSPLTLRGRDGGRMAGMKADSTSMGELSTSLQPGEEKIQAPHSALGDVGKCGAMVFL